MGVFCFDFLSLNFRITAVRTSIHPSIHFHKYLLSTYYVPGTIWSIEKTILQNRQNSCSHAAYILVRLQSDLGQLSLPALSFKAVMRTPPSRAIVSEWGGTMRLEWGTYTKPFSAPSPCKSPADGHCCYRDDSIIIYYYLGQRAGRKILPQCLREEVGWWGKGRYEDGKKNWEKALEGENWKPGSRVEAQSSKQWGW